MEEKIENVRYYYESEEGIQYIKYRNIWGTYDGNFDGLIWNYKDKEMKLKLDEDVYCIYIHMYRHRIFMLFNGDSQHHPAPNNLVVYTPTGEIERILTTPILPNGRKGAGFMELGSSRHYLEKDMMNDKYLNVVVWEHEHSQWVDYYHLNTETLEFTFRHIGRY